jgi:hypothetical protein
MTVAKQLSCQVKFGLKCGVELFAKSEIDNALKILNSYEFKITMEKTETLRISSKI